MKKLTGLTFFIACVAILLGACSKSKSYADYVKEEKKNIENFRNERDIVVLKDYPTNRAFKDNEYYLDESGVYINVIDSGNGKRAEFKNIVNIRFSGASTLPIAEADTVNLSDISTQPMDITYGISSTYINTLSSRSAQYTYLSPGMVVPLKYVGEGAIVRLIIPFKNYIGSTFQNSSYRTFYFDRVEYTTIY